jgi:hypothetical protein
MMFAIMDGLELQWLLDPTVDMVALFNHYLDEAIERWQKRRSPERHSDDGYSSALGPAVHRARNRRTRPPSLRTGRTFAAVAWAYGLPRPCRRLPHQAATVRLT